MDNVDDCLDFADDSETRIVLNVGGVSHVTLLSTLASKPNTRLYELARSHVIGSDDDEYFFNRHPRVFNSVIDFYRSGHLHVPLDVCGSVVKRELDFWQIDDIEIEACCWISYSSYIDNQNTLAEYNGRVARQQQQLHAADTLTGWRRQRMRFWILLDHPDSSRAAFIYAMTSFGFVIASIAGFCLETLPLGRPPPGSANETDCAEAASRDAFYYLDVICTCFFSVELVVRFAFAADKARFVRAPINVIDALALLPLYVEFAFHVSPSRCHDTPQGRDGIAVQTVLLLRIIRIFRVFHLVKNYRALSILMHSIRASVHELLMLAVFLLIAMLVFATLVYYAERPPPGDCRANQFCTIPAGFWWSIVTMCTVGYGDLVPRTPLGYTVGILCAISGVLLLVLTIPVISNNFTLFYIHGKTRDKLLKKNGVEETTRRDESGRHVTRSEESSSHVTEAVGHSH